MDHPKQDLIMRSTSLDNHYVYVASSIKWISYLRNSRTTPSLNSTVKRETKKIGVAPHWFIHHSGKNWFIEMEYLGRIRLEKEISYHVYPFEFRNTNTGIIERFV